jgi:hypothetical protein
LRTKSSEVGRCPFMPERWNYRDKE